jgi:DNA-binding NtrC family response regulator
MVHIHSFHTPLIGRDHPVLRGSAVAGAGSAGDDEVGIALVDESTDVLAEEPAVVETARGTTAAETVECLIEMLSTGGHDAAKNALRMVVREANAIGAGLVEWTGRGEARFITFCGPMARMTDQPEVARFYSEAARRRDGQPFCVTTLVEGGLRYACAAFGRRGEELLTLTLWGDAGARFDDLALARIVLRMADRMRPPRAPRGKPEAIELAADFPESHLPGRAPRMLETYRQMRMFAAADFPLLVVGETGVGKEHIVRALHTWSRRRRGPFVAVNCAAIPDTLLEAEMFGIGRGVASGVHERDGKFRLAEGGTLFLDEIGELPPPLQAKLLRVLQDHQVTPVGAPPVDVDVRVIAATNADLEQKLRAGTFRSDLYYRLAGSIVRVPPLRERRSDIARLIEHFLHKFSAELERPIRGLSVRGLELLVQYAWPGNVRELEHEIRRLVYTCAPGQLIDSSQLSESITLAAPAPESHASSTLDLATRVAELERDLIHQALRRTRGNRTVAARLLGLSRNGLALKMQRLDFD